MLRCGCLALLALVLALVASLLALAWLATRPIGPSYSNGSYTVKLAGGTTRVDRISSDAAQSFAAKIAPPTSVLGAAELQLRGIDLSEEEINSELAQQLAAAPVSASGLTIDRIFLELHPSTSRVYVFGHFHGQPVTLSSHVEFSVANGAGQVTLSDARLGDLPLGALWPVLLDWSGNRQAVEQRLAVTLPKQVSSISPREGTLHITVELQRTFTRKDPLSHSPFPPARGERGNDGNQVSAEEALAMG